MDGAEEIRLIVADDYDMVRRGLAVFINATPRLNLIGEATDGKEAIDLCRQLKPDVVLIDVAMPGTNGPTAIREIRRHHPDIQCIALSAYSDDQSVQSAFEAGAISYLTKDASANELARAIFDAAAGKATIAPDAVQVLVRETQKPQLDSQLTEREQEVLQFLKQGKSNADIASELSVAVSTVKKHVSNILEKLNVESRTAVITSAARRGL